jgi:hypothetical protein
MFFYKSYHVANTLNCLSYFFYLVLQYRKCILNTVVHKYIIGCPKNQAQYVRGQLSSVEFGNYLACLQLLYSFACYRGDIFRVQARRVSQCSAIERSVVDCVRIVEKFCSCHNIRKRGKHTTFYDVSYTVYTPRFLFRIPLWFAQHDMFVL